MGPASSLVPPKWYSGTQSCQTTSLHANSSLVAQWDPPLPNFFPTSQFLPLWHMGNCLFSSSPPVVQWDPSLPSFFPTCKCIPSGTMGPTPAQILPYFMRPVSSLVLPYWYSGPCLLSSSSLVIQWDLPPL